MANSLNEVDYQNGLLLHHWDTDGMSAGALILRNFPDLSTFTPSIGNYYLNEKDKEKIKKTNPDIVVVVDMALPVESIEFLKDFGKVYIFDHHLQEKHDVELHHNPVIDGGSPMRYPSASWVVTEYFDSKPSLLTILGAFGDREDKLKENEYAIETIDVLLDEWGSNFDDLLKCTEYLDTLYKLGKRKQIESMPHDLKDFKEPEDVLGLEDLKRNSVALDSAIERESKGNVIKLEKNILFKEMESPYNIISTVTRRIAWSREDKIVIVSNCKFKEGECQIYIRGPIPDSEKVINIAKQKGFSAGGKEDVVGMVVPTEEKEEFLKELANLLKK